MSFASLVAVLAAVTAAVCSIEPEPELAVSRDFGPGESPIGAIYGSDSPDDGRWMAVFCSDGRLTLFDASGRRGELPVTNVTAADMSADGQLLVTGHADGEVRVWHAPKRYGAAFAVAAAFRVHGAAVRAIALSEDPRYAVSGDTDGLIVVRDLETGAVEWTANLTGNVNEVAISPVGDAIAFACDGRQVGLVRSFSWDVRWIADDADRARSLRFSHCGNRLLIGRFDGGVTYWNVRAERVLWASGPVGKDDAVRSLAISADGKVAAGSQFVGITLWDMQNGQTLGRIESHSQPAVSLRFVDQDTQLQAFCRDGFARLWDLATPSEPVTWELVDPTGVRPTATPPG